MGPGLKRVSRLVEADMAVGAEAEDHQIDAAGALDRALEARAFPVGVPDRPVKEVNLLPRNVDMVEQVAVHERTIASRIGRIDAEEFVEIEGGRRRKIEPSPV